MYLYLYGTPTADHAYASVVADIETRITDQGMQGRVGRLGPLRSAIELITSARKGGVKTVVAVGDDRTIAETVNALMAFPELTLGIVPVGNNNRIGKLLGIPSGGDAVDVLAARKIETVDVGKMNNYYFLTSAEIRGAEPLALECDDRFTVAPRGAATLTINNLGPDSQCQDGSLDAIFETDVRQSWWSRQSQRSIVPVQHARITGTGGTALAEGYFPVKLPATVDIIPQALRIIVGRDRVF